MPRVLDLLYGEGTYQKVSKTNLLIIGVGGIGCELLKSLSKSGFKKFTILDLDHIEQTNLNRQFLFRKKHVGQSKANIGKEIMNLLDPSIQVTSFCDNIFQPKYDASFFSQFDLVVSALDNVPARRHLSKMAIKAGKSVIDAGTQGLSGQAKAVKRFQTDCHNCTQMKSVETFAVCLVRDTPEKPVHCAAYAKSLYEGLFGTDSSNPLIQQIDTKKYVDEKFSDQQIKQAAQKLFNILFFEKISNKLAAHSQKGMQTVIFPVNYEQAINSKDPVVNPKSTFNELKFKKQQASVYPEEKLLSLSEYAQMFMTSFFNIIKTQKDFIGSLKFEKDDPNCMRFVYAVTSLRTFNFMSSQNTANKHQFLSFYDCKDMVGKIIAAISSTNSIAAAIQTSDIFRLLLNKSDQLRYVTFHSFSNPRINVLGNQDPNPDCPVCSLRCIYMRINCDFQKTSYRELEEFLNHNFASGRIPNVRDNQGLNYGMEYDDEDKDIKIIKFKKLIQCHETQAPHGAFELNYSYEKQNPINLSVLVINKPGTEGIVPEKGSQKEVSSNFILRYLRNKKETEIEDRTYEYGRYGYVG